MSPASKFSALAAILIADLLFFLFIGIHYPELFNNLLRLLPWRDSLERGILVIAGLVIAVITSTAIVQVLIKTIQGKTR